jgi:hypothetical protein
MFEHRVIEFPPTRIHGSPLAVTLVLLIVSGTSASQFHMTGSSPRCASASLPMHSRAIGTSFSPTRGGDLADSTS